MEDTNGEPSCTSKCTHSILTDKQPIETLSLSEEDQINLAIQKSLRENVILTPNTLSTNDPTTSSSSSSSTTTIPTMNTHSIVGYKYEQFLGSKEGMFYLNYKKLYEHF